VLDRFPSLRLILAYGGGAFPYLAGRVDFMFERTGVTTASPPSAYLDRPYYDTLLHDATALRYLAGRVGVDHLVIGTDDGFPPVDRDPLASLRRAGFSKVEVARIGDTNPRTIFRRW
jgi:aminocarboxymuconate-semialdehyde decarboxylase